MDFSKLKGKKVEPGSVEHEAAKKALEGISKREGDKMSNGLKKVSVAASNKAGLEKGLEMAKKVISSDEIGGGLEGDSGMLDSSTEENSESINESSPLLDTKIEDFERMAGAIRN